MDNDPAPTTAQTPTGRGPNRKLLSMSSATAAAALRRAGYPVQQTRSTCIKRANDVYRIEAGGRRFFLRAHTLPLRSAKHPVDAPFGPRPSDRCQPDYVIAFAGIDTGRNSMLSLGAAAIQRGEIVNMFSGNLDCLPEAEAGSDAVEWGSRFPGEWALARENARPPDVVMQEFGAWLQGLGAEQLVALAAPAAFDFAFVNYYCHRFLGSNPLHYACLDLLSLALGALRAPRYWGLEGTLDGEVGITRDPARRQHLALDDAIAQAETFLALVKVARLPLA